MYKIFDAQDMFEMIKEQRKNYSSTLTIGQLSNKLNNYDDNRIIKLSNGRYITDEFDSYRGYYEDMYIGYLPEDGGCNTVKSLKNILYKALKCGTMTGYKGGTYNITPDTLLWLGQYGECGGLAILDLTEIDGKLYLILKQTEE